MTAWQTGNYVEAKELQEEAFVIQLRTNYAVGQAISNLYLGFFHFLQAQFEEGRVQVQLGLDQALEIADFSTQAWRYAMLSWFQAARGDSANATEDLERAELIATDPFRQTGGGNPFLQLIINLDKFLLEVDKGDFEKSREYLLQPLNLMVMTASQPFMSMFPSLAALVIGRDPSSESCRVTGAHI
jgi:hypothetical protein